jgi:hypothetical protein
MPIASFSLDGKAALVTGGSRGKRLAPGLIKTEFSFALWQDEERL